MPAVERQRLLTASTGNLVLLGKKRGREKLGRRIMTMTIWMTMKIWSYRVVFLLDI